MPEQIYDKPPKTFEEFESRTEAIRKAVEILRTEGNWMVDEVARGYVNGLIICLSLLEGTIPEFIGQIPLEQLKILLDKNHPFVNGKVQ